MISESMGRGEDLDPVIQLIIKDLSGDQILVELHIASTVLELKQLLNSIKSLSVTEQHLYLDGQELKNSDTLRAAGLWNLATVSLSMKSLREDSIYSEQNVTTNRSGKQANRVGQYHSELLSDVVQHDELPRAIVITGIPSRSREQTEDALVDTFSCFGEITRLIVQSDSTQEQHAVLIFSSEEACKAATSNGKQFALLGKSVTVVVATELAPVTSPGEHSSALEEASDALSSLLAGSVKLGKQVIFTVAKISEEQKISSSVREGANTAKASVNKLDAKTGLSNRVMDAAKKARGTATELDGKLQITETVGSLGQMAVQSAAGTAQQVSAKAMQNEVVSAGVKKLNTLLTAISAFGTKTISQTKAKIAENDMQAAPAPPVSFPAPQPPAPIVGTFPTAHENGHFSNSSPQSLSLSPTARGRKGRANDGSVGASQSDHRNSSNNNFKDI